MKDREWMSIPVLKYVAIDATLAFWETLGFKITYRQDRPYKYAVMERNGCNLHLYHNKSMDISTPGNGCLIIVNDIQNIYQELSGSLKRKLGRVPSSGLPRISRMKPMGTRFTVTDPSGNPVILIQRGDKDKADYEIADQKGLTGLGKSIALAVRLRDFKEDYPAAAKTLDNALKKHLSEVEEGQKAEALIIRAELARTLNDYIKETQCYKLLADLDLSTNKKR
ncbi:hypothetical protein QF042_004796 [Pedobacter sp. W3I1]|uniref:VOC family protein n=1 Tax=Pedobacter sp. W3I1 TaxID=3042291 RepID=UPI002781599D|nr:VOC family protein [Pedobacter sp. W3I1]MDQ0641231.1 hypothetical protein [Pedobacter sp. W3I1]